LYSLPNLIRIAKSRRMRWVGHIARIWRRESCIGYVDNIRMNIGEVGWGDVDWICLAQDWNRWRALVYSVWNLRVP
jgi:hypothetical protein